MKPSEHTRKKAERLFEAFGDLPPQYIESVQRHDSPRPRVHPRRALTVLLAASLAILLMTFTVFAASPGLRKLLNMPFLDENTRKDTVPEGWIGIYTTDDLDAVRNDLSGNYILMNDLTFADGETFTPIGTQESPFMGQFDGNGYVIRNLTIDVTQPAPPVVEARYGSTAVFYHKITPMSFVGLFGFCGHSQLNTNPHVNSTINDFAFPYLTDERYYRGMICNLGVEGATVKVSDASNVRVGVIAGQGSYVVGCYVEDCTVDLTAYEASVENAHFRLRMGGIAGNAQVLDSCYATGCKLTVTGANELLSDHLNIDDMNTSEKATVFVGGLAGNAYTIVTSYAEDNEITCDYAADRQREWWYRDCPAYVGELYGHVHLLPSVMNYSSFMELKMAMFRAVCGLTEDDPLPDDWDCGGSLPDKIRIDYWQFRGHYIDQPMSILAEYFEIDPDEINPSLFTGDFTWETDAYVFDRSSGMDGLIRAETLALKHLGDARLAELVSVDNLKVGPLDCYVLSPYQDYDESDLDGFNFDTIWEIKDGRPVLRIFG